MTFRKQASRQVLKMIVCLGVASGLAVLGCSGEYGSSPSNKETIKEAINNSPEVNQAAGSKHGKKIVTKSIKQQLFKNKAAE